MVTIPNFCSVVNNRTKKKIPAIAVTGTQHLVKDGWMVLSSETLNKVMQLDYTTPAILQEYATGLKLRGYAKRHLTNILTVFSAALNYAVEPMHYLASNPMQYVKFPKVEKKPRERIILTLDEWQRIRDRFEGTRYYIPLMIGYYTGLRISETFGLTWDDIDLEKKALSVNKQIVKRNFGADVRKAVEKKGKKELRSSWYFAPPKTAASMRVVPFGETLYQALKQEKTKQLENEMKYGEYYLVICQQRWLQKKCFQHTAASKNAMIPLPAA